MAILEIRKQGLRQEHKKDYDGDIFHLNTVISKPFHKDFNPFIIGPVQLKNGLHSMNMENAWQFSKVYKTHVDKNNDPTQAWHIWSINGFNDNKAHRRPMGREKPLYSWWDNVKLGYVEARKKIYWPLYQQGVLLNRGSWKQLLDIYQNAKRLVIWDYDGYPMRGLTFTQVINDETKIMGHAFVLAAMLTHHAAITPEELISKGL